LERCGEGVGVGRSVDADGQAGDERELVADGVRWLRRWRDDADTR
jgi:hypothetical protein